MNDTRGHHHFGCQRVMSFIENQLESRNMKVIAKSLVRHDWERDQHFLRRLAEADLILINGEGTLHHGSRHGERLLRIVHHPARQNKPVAIVNALYQANPASWGQYLKGINLIAARDGRSYRELQESFAGDLFQTLDFSLGQGYLPSTDGHLRAHLVVGESVLGDVSRAILSSARNRTDFLFVPIMTTLKSSKPQYSFVPWLLRELYIYLHRELFRLRYPKSKFVSGKFSYAKEIAAAYLHVTGRFHAVCFSLITQTPFLALSSNSWKIEALIEDVGLSKERIVSVEELERIMGQPSLSNRFRYSDLELDNLNAAFESNHRAVLCLFDRLNQLAAGAN